MPTVYTRDLIKQNVVAYAKSFISNQKKHILTFDILLLVQNLKESQNSGQNLAYLYHLLVDNDIYTDQKLRGMFSVLADQLYDEIPELPANVKKLRALSPEIFAFILNSRAPTLRELALNSKIELQEEWKDLITTNVMNYPVDYTVGSTQYTCDLFTLLENSDTSCALRCPHTRQYVLLSDLKPNYVIGRAVREAVAKTDPLSKNNAAELKKAVALIRADNLPALKEWYTQNPQIDLNEFVQDGENREWNLLHFACKLGHFAIALWLISVGAAYAKPNAAGQNAIKIIDPDQLKAALRNDPNNPGLKFLLALFSFGRHEAEYKDLYFTYMPQIVNAGYTPAYSHYGSFMCMTGNPMHARVGLDLILKAMQKQCADSISSMFSIFMSITLGHPEFAATAAILPTKNDEFTKSVQTLLSDDRVKIARYRIEELGSYFLQNKAKSKPNKGYDLIKALCLDLLADSRQKKTMPKPSFFTPIYEAISAGNEFKISYVLANSQQTGVKKPWVTIKPYS